MNPDAFPLPVRWRSELDWFCLVADAPVVLGEVVVARCGQAVVAFGRGDGALVWEAPLDPRAGDGGGFTFDGTRFLTEFRRRPQRLSTIVAVLADGQEAWRTDLPTIVSRGGLRVVGDDLLVLGRDPQGGQVLAALDLAGGVVRSSVVSPWPALALVELEGRLLVANANSGPDWPGLYLLDREGGSPESVADDPVWQLVRQGELVMTLSQASPAQARVVAVRDAATLQLRWSAPAQGDAADLDGDTVFSVDPGPDNGRLAARDAVTGEPRWRSDPLASAVVSITAAGPVVLCSHLAGVTLHRSTDGSLLGESTGGWFRPTVDSDALYAGGKRAVVCAALPAWLPGRS